MKTKFANRLKSGLLIVSACLCGMMGATAQEALPTTVKGEPVGTPELVAAACKEGQVNFYSGQNSDDERQILEDFNKTFPCVRVNIISMNTGRLYERIRSEAEGGIVTADTVLITDVRLAKILEDEGALRPWNPPVGDRFPKDAKKEGVWYSASSSLSVPIYNTLLIPEDQAPKTWRDLLRPEFAGKIGLSPIGSGGIQWISYAFMDKILGTDYMEELAKLKPQFYTTYPPLVLGVARQEITAGIVASLNEYPVRVRQKAPIKALFPAEGVPMVHYPMMLFSKSPNPAAGELLANYYLTATGQANLVRVRGAYSLRIDVPAPTGNPPISEVNLWSVPTEQFIAEYDSVRQRFNEVFKQ